MKSSSRFFGIIFFLITSALIARDPVKQTHTDARIFGFTENKGQIHDQDYKQRPDVLFGGYDGRMSYHLKRDGVSYQLYKMTISGHTEAAGPMFADRPEMTQRTNYEISRIDIRWLNVNSDVSVHGENEFADRSHYYNGLTPDGIENVKTYAGVKYNELYSGISLNWYSQAGSLKYDFIVAAGADYRQIIMQVSGASHVAVNSGGQLVITTPHGNLTEEAPVVTQKGETLSARWVAKGDLVSFEIRGVDPDAELIIDPAVRVWATYYGGNDHDYIYATTTDASGNVYVAGWTQSQNGVSGAVIATSGAHQVNYQGSVDGFIAKFNSTGVRQWGTFYGAFGQESFYDATVDINGNLYVAGYTTAAHLTLTTLGAHQTSGSGAGDALLAKFNSSGVRIWATLYGDNGIDYGEAVVTDALANVYLCGTASPHTGTTIATPGVFQPASGGGADAFLAKFNSAGVRQWGTSIGGAISEYGVECDADPSGNVYVVGYLNASTTDTYLATSNAHQTITAGSTDVFVVKFNSSGARLWGTYMGGVNQDRAYGGCADGNGEFYICGATSEVTGTVVATPNGHQPSIPNLSSAAFLVKFSAAGVRQWGTLYPTSALACDVDAGNNVFMTGMAGSTTGVATPGSFQTTMAGWWDGYLVKFNSGGVRQWGTYFGDVNADQSNDCVCGPTGEIYCGGETNSHSNISTPSSHQPVHGSPGYIDAMLIRFNDCASLPSPPVSTTPTSGLAICIGQTTTLSATGSGTISWHDLAVGGTVIGSGSVYIVSPSNPGVYTVYAANNDCAPSASRTPISFTVNALPQLTVTPGDICPGTTATLVASGASSYSWSTGTTGATMTFAPLSTQSVMVTGTSQAGCSNSAIATVTVRSKPVVTIAGGAGTRCAGQIFTLAATGADTYTWSGGENGSVISVSLQATSVYTVTGMAGNGCTDTKSVTIVVDPCAGISITDDQMGARIFPNPFYDKLFIDFQGSVEHEITLYNISGQVVYRSLVCGHAMIDTAALPEGVYLVQAGEVWVGVYFKL